MTDQSTIDNFDELLKQLEGKDNKIIDGTKEQYDKKIRKMCEKCKREEFSREQNCIVCIKCGTVHSSDILETTPENENEYVGMAVNSTRSNLELLAYFYKILSKNN
jgi:ribosomal protein L37AE/L43A